MSSNGLRKPTTNFNILSVSRESNLVPAQYEGLAIISKAVIFRAQLHSSAQFDRIKFKVNISETHKIQKPTTVRSTL